MGEHTPTPWNCASAYSSIVGVPIIAQNGQRIGNTALPNVPENMPPEWDEFKRLAVANAAFIVKAVNNHDALVKALSDARNAIASLPMEALGYASDPTGEQIHWPIRDELLHRIDEALSPASTPDLHGEGG